jgi:hypothetical protein
MANGEFPEPLHTSPSNTQLTSRIPERHLDFKQRISDVEHLYVEGRDILVRPPEGKTLIEREREVVKDGIRNGFLVNDDTTGGCSQLNASIALDANGYFVICWQDRRNGDNDIYAQRYDASGNPQGTNFRVNDDVGLGEQRNASVVLAVFGDFVICWDDDRNGDNDIYAQRYDASGNPQGTNFRVNDDAGTSSQRRPFVAQAKDINGDFVICWQDERNGDSDIYAQWYDESGNPQGTNFKVNDDAGTSDQTYSSVALDMGGYFVICWQDDRNGDDDTYAQRYDASGIPQGTNFRVDDDPGTANQNRPSVAMDPAGNFVITWYDYRNGNYDIYTQMYDAAGTPLGANFLVNDDGGTATQAVPTVAIDTVGNFVITWYDYRNGNYDIYTQMYDAAGTPLGANLKVNDDLGTATQYQGVVGMDQAGNFVIVWYDYRNGDSDIYAQMYDAAGNPQHPNNFMVNDDVESCQQYEPCVAMDGAGNFVISWYDARNGDNDIWAQRYDAAGTPIGANFKVNDDETGMTNLQPYIGMNASGNFVICWSDARSGVDYDVYAQLYDASGNPVGVNFLVNDDPPGIYDYAGNVEMAPSGNFVIAFQDWRNGSMDYDIYAQLYDATGTPLGANFRVNDDPAGNWNIGPYIAMDGAGNFVITWHDSRDGPGNECNIFAQMYDAAGHPVGANFRVCDAPGYQMWSSVALDLAGDFVVSWYDWRDGDTHEYTDIYARMYDAAGAPLDTNFRVNDDIGLLVENSYPSTAMDPDGDKFVIAFNDFRNPDGDPEFMAQFYENGNPVGGNVQINEPDLFPYCHQYTNINSVGCTHDTLIFTWMDNRRHKGWDIYAKLTNWLETGIEEDGRREVSGIGLVAKPNPFRSCITISGVNTELDIYDISGRLIGRTENGVWDGVDLNGREVEAGVYFLKAESSYSHALKVIKLK